MDQPGARDVLDPHDQYRDPKGNFLEDKLIIAHETDSLQKSVDQLKLWRQQIQNSLDSKTKYYLTVFLDNGI